MLIKLLCRPLWMLSLTKQKTKWTSTADVKRHYATASIVTAGRIVFKIKGNAYRLIVSVDFGKNIVWIKWVDTRKDYNKIDVKEVEYEKPLTHQN